MENLIETRAQDCAAGQHVDTAARMGWGPNMLPVWRCEGCGRRLPMSAEDLDSWAMVLAEVYDCGWSTTPLDVVS